MKPLEPLKISKGELIIKSINHIEKISRQSGKNIIHLTIHPEKSLYPNQLSHLIRRTVVRHLNEQCKIRNEYLLTLYVIEYGKDIIELLNDNITRLGTHAHLILSTNLSVEFIEEKAKQFFPHEASVKATVIDSFYNKNYWVKDFHLFGDIVFWSNNKYLDVA